MAKKKHGRESVLKKLWQKQAEIAKRHGLLLLVDNTFLSPYFQNPLELGANLVIHSGTKFLGGHNDALAGFLVTNRKELSERLRFLYKRQGLFCRLSTAGLFSEESRRWASAWRERRKMRWRLRSG